MEYIACPCENTTFMCRLVDGNVQLKCTGCPGAITLYTTHRAVVSFPPPRATEGPVHVEMPPQVVPHDLKRASDDMDKETTSKKLCTERVQEDSPPLEFVEESLKRSIDSDTDQKDNKKRA